MPANALRPVDFLPLTPVALEILLAVGRSSRHGYDILLAIERRTAGRLSPNPGTLYRAIDRLVRQGLLEAEARKGDRGSQRVYCISRFGAQVAAAELERLADQLHAGRQVRFFKITGGS
jgi:DNA-binding PadR family transcriptional regulator